MTRSMYLWRFLVLIICSVHATSLQPHGDGNYCVKSDESYCSRQCAPFMDVIHTLRSNSTVIFCPGKIVLDVTISLRNLSSITFLGQTDTTTLTCNRKHVGLEFSGVEGLRIENLKIVGCGAEHHSTTQTTFLSDETVLFNSAIYIINCTNVSMNNIHILESQGTGLVLYDTNGRVEILNSTFNLNAVSPNNPSVGGGGVYIEFTICTPGVYCTEFENKQDSYNLRARNTVYIIENCVFSNNTAFFNGPKYSQYSNDRKRLDHQGIGRGGGLSIHLNGKSEFNNFVIENCTFEGNKANWGGGLYIVLQDLSSHNTVRLIQLIVVENECKQNGGGGVDLGFNIATAKNNTVEFEHCLFSKNSAQYGGGVRIYSSRRNESRLQNIVSFSYCKWTQNRARFGSAIDIAPHVWEVLAGGFLPVPVFHSCTFLFNYASPVLVNSTNGVYTQYLTGRGAMMITRFNVTFAGFMAFRSNTGSAIYLSSSIVITKPQTTCDFTGNNGFEGGAIAFIGYSALFVHESNAFQFLYNTAVRRGGALYVYAIDKHEFVSSRSCFIQYHGSLTDEKNVTFIFSHNLAGPHYDPLNTEECFALGHSIFSASLQTCIHACNHTIRDRDGPTHDITFKCVGEFKFTEDIQCEVSTSGGKFHIPPQLQKEEYLKLFPGKEIELEISVQNDFNQSINAVYYASINKDSNITINGPYKYISNQRIQLHGSPGETGVLRLQKLGFRDIIIEIKVLLQECPPGYVLKSVQGVNKCVCSASNHKHSFKPIQECDETSFRARLQRGYWLGYSGNELEYGYCPSGHCFFSSVHNKSHQLPNQSTTREDLDRIVCGERRTGRLCGECRVNYSVHYHGKDFQCESNHSCTYGWLLYIITELLPLTALFVLATVFNISFTSGAVNGFIWFAQVFSSIPLTGKSFIVFPNAVYEIVTANKMIYNLFNFDFFSHNKLSFCLWRGATALDMLVFKFVTVVYATFLVIVTVGLINYCNFFRKCRCLRFSAVKSSIIHGLSSVLVMVFSQCVKVCFRVLELSYIIGKGNKYDKSVIFIQGNLEPFTGEHIKYAIIAIMCLLIMLIPLLLLLIYPAVFKLLKLFKCGDTNKVARVLFHIPYSKFKPFLDSFQSCFKDDFRVFAGLYFVYRVLIISATVFPKLSQQYGTLDILLLTFLLIHAIAQPYRTRWHNILDGLLFFNLAVITKISKLNYDYSKFSNSEEFNPVPYTSTVLIVITNIPLIYMLLYVFIKLVLKIKHACQKKESANNSSLNQADYWDAIEMRNRDQESDSDDSTDYQPFHNVMFDLDSYAYT